MKKIVLIFLCLLSFGLITNAQSTTPDNTKKTKQDKVDNREAKMDSTRKSNLKEKGITEENLKQLDLSNDQQKQLEQMHHDMRNQKEKIKNDASLTEDQKNEKLRSIDKDYKGKLESVLTKEQKQKIQKEKQNKKTNP